MMKLFLPAFLIVSCAIALNAENNSSAHTNPNTENNSSAHTDKIEKQIQEQIKREEKYAKEKVFYQDSDYNLSEAEVDENSLSSIPVLEPEYDFDMDDVYSD